MADFFPVILIGGIIFLIGYKLFAEANSPDMICMDCGTTGAGKDQIKGNGLIELILWLCFIIPGLIYSIWRSASKTRVCSVCQGKVIQLDTPRGQQLYKQFMAD